MTANERELSWPTHGAERFHGAVRDRVGALRAMFAAVSQDKAGVRLTDIPALRPLLAADGQIGAIARHAIGRDCQPVRALLFDKSPRVNWALGWHQDRTICVREHVEAAGFGPWTKKAGMQHVVPPFALLSRMVTLRIHLDDVSADNGPLRIAPGSHLCGRVPEAGIAECVRALGAYDCLAEAGDVWLYATPILHASDRARIAARRRVLQVDFTTDALPDGLEWLGV